MNDSSIILLLQFGESLLLLFFLYFPLFLNTKQIFILSACAFCILPIIIYAPPQLSVLFIIFFHIIKFIMVKHRFENWIVPTLLFLGNLTVISLLWLFTFDVPRILKGFYFSINIGFYVVSSLIRILLILMACLTLKYLNKKWHIFDALFNVKRQGRNLSLFSLLIFWLLWIVHRFFFYPKNIPSFFFGFLLFLISGGLFSIILYIIILSFNKNSEYKRLSVELAAINKTYESTSEFQHDFKNILSSLKSYLDNEQWSAAIQYIDSIIDYSSSELAPSYYHQLSKINVTPIRSILTIYMEKMTAKNISCQLSVLDYITYINVDVIDVVRCLSILLDNAFEAIQTQADGSIKIQLYRKADSTIFQIENSVDTPLSIKDLYKLGYTKKKDSSGQGLYIVSKITKKYTNLDIFISIENDIFTAKLVVTD